MISVTVTEPSSLHALLFGREKGYWISSEYLSITYVLKVTDSLNIQWLIGKVLYMMHRATKQLNTASTVGFSQQRISIICARCEHICHCCTTKDGGNKQLPSFAFAHAHLVLEIGTVESLST